MFIVKIMHEIKIYGEIVPFNNERYNETVAYSLVDLQNDLKDAGGSDVYVRINSIGGNLPEAYAMYSELRRYAAENGVKITTVAERQCASSATIILTAGDVRYCDPFTSPLIHNSWIIAEGDYKEMERVANILKESRDRLAQHYVEHTNLTFDECIALMEMEHNLSPIEAKAIGLVDEIIEIKRPQKAEKIIQNKLNTDTKMSTKKSPSKGILEQIKALVIGAEIKNLELHTADGATLVFADVEDREPQVGDYATMDGQPANGKYVVYDGEKTFVFGDGYLNEIIDNEDGEELREENAQLLEAVNLLKEKFEEVSNLLKDEKIKNAQLTAKIKASSKEVVEPVNVKKGEVKENDISLATQNAGKRQFKFKK